MIGIDRKEGKLSENKFRAARRASDMTAEKAGDICGISRATYQQREASPEDFRLSELKMMYENLSATAKPIMVDAIGLFICGNDYVKRN